MDSSYRYVVWEEKEPSQQGLMLDPRQTKLLDEVAKSGSRFDQLVRRPPVQAFLVRAAGLLGRPPAGAQSPPPPRGERDNLVGAVAKQDGDPQAGPRREVSALLEQGLCFRGNCPSCGHSMSWAIPFGVLVDQNELVKMVRKDGLASAAGTFISRWPWKVPESGPALYAGSRPDNPTITFVCACGYDHPGRPSDAAFVGCGAAWNQEMRG